MDRFRTGNATKGKGIRMRISTAIGIALIGVSVCGAAPARGQACGKAAADALRTCVKGVATLQRQCYRATGSACAGGDTKLAKRLARVGARLSSRCPDAAAVSGAGFASLLTPAALVQRIENACVQAVASLAARTYGGPHGAARAAAAPAERDCLDNAWREGQKLIDFELRQRSTCIRKVAAGRPCDTAKLAVKLTQRASRTTAAVDAGCPTSLTDLVAISSSLFTNRTVSQARCLVPVAHPVTAPFALDCGPRAAVPVPARGVPTQVVLPHAEWGTRCGDGSDYAFQVRLAPAGSPVQDVVVFMQGGGACYDGAGCASVSAGLFEALADGLPTGGIMSNTASANPFRDWTKVYLPYCTQDLHIGGGVVNPYPQITVHRFGGVNVRAALRYVRDVLWAELDANDPQGYRDDRPRVVFSGGSAGGYGAAYNYHWVLDDLGWVNTTAAPDAALGMHNDTIAGVITLGVIVLPSAHPGWNVRPMMPPYCHFGMCAEILDNLNLATAPRLLGTPHQQVLTISNQIDTTQRNTTLFASHPAFVNTLRTNYCNTQGVPGLRYFLRGSSTSIHGQVANSTHWNGATVGGTVMRDWLGAAMDDPDAVVDRVEEGTIVADFPGSVAFPCSID